MNRRRPKRSSVRYMLAGGSAIAAVGLLVDPTHLMPKPAPTKDLCQEIVQPTAALSRQQLSALLAVPERSPKANLKQVINQPYCKLPGLQVRSGTTAQREAYPLAFDPQTWFVVLYEGDEYVGYSFSFRHD